jgi:hypothetical protein
MATAPQRSGLAETSSSRRVLGSPSWYRVGPWPAILGVDDRCGEVVVQDRAPVIGVVVGREDHRALRLMSVVDDVVEEVGRVLAVREVADFVESTMSTCGAT